MIATTIFSKYMSSLAGGESLLVKIIPLFFSFLTGMFYRKGLPLLPGAGCQCCKGKLAHNSFQLAGRESSCISFLACRIVLLVLTFKFCHRKPLCSKVAPIEIKRQIIKGAKQLDVKMRYKNLPPKCLKLCKKQSFLLTVRQISNPGMKSH